MKLADVTSEAVKNATGKSWEQWIAYLDETEATALSHTEITKLLKLENLSSWWQQKIASGYRLHKGLRKQGQTSNIYQAGARKVFPLSLQKAWDFIISPEIVEYWNKGNETSNDINIFKPNSHLRISWEEKGWSKPAILQIRVIPTGRKTTISFLHTNLSEEYQQKEMKKHWKQVLEELLKMAENIS